MREPEVTPGTAEAHGDMTDGRRVRAEERQKVTQEFAALFHSRLLEAGFSNSHELITRHQKAGTSLATVLPNRVASDFERVGLTHVWQVLLLTEDELLTIPQIKERKIEQLFQALHAMGFKRGESTPEDR